MTKAGTKTASKGNKGMASKAKGSIIAIPAKTYDSSVDSSDDEQEGISELGKRTYAGKKTQLHKVYIYTFRTSIHHYWYRIHIHTYTY